jgi:hypothetical protein
MKNSKFILILALITFVVCGFPLLIYGIKNTFFLSIDPDIVYITNALLYTKYAIISYVDHPGTPSIMLLYYLFFPLRIYAKYFLHTGFIEWSFDNFGLLTYLCRFFELLVFCSSLFIFLKSISTFIKSNLLIIFAWVSIFVLLGFDWGVRVVPENFSFFLTAIWLLIFTKFIKSRSYILNIILVILSGFAVANKLTGIFLAVCSVTLPLFGKKLKLDQKFFKLETNIVLFLGSFYLGILPAVRHLTYIKSWIRSLFEHAGTHATGVAAVFDWPSYSGSVISLLTSHPFVFIYIGLSIVLVIWLLVKKKIRFTDPILYVFLITFLGILIFAKYPIIHYFFVNSILIVFCTTYFLTKINFKFLKYIIGILIIMAVMNLISFTNITSNQLGKYSNVSIYPTIKSWTPFWASDIFKEQFEASDSTNF